MEIKELKNKPLVEAIMEVRWILPGKKGGLEEDPNYRVLLGRFSERIQAEYPFYEPLATASIPDELVSHSVQHRFRVKEAGWPLVQIGPGVMTVNETQGYKWDDYRKRCEFAFEKLCESHPKKTDFKLNKCLLRYIDAIDFDFKAGNAFKFIEDNLKVKVALPENLFADIDMSPNPIAFNWQSTFGKEETKNRVTLKFSSGNNNNAPAILWETIFKSEDGCIIEASEKFAKWLEDAHKITDDWFFKLIKGDLLRRFTGE